MSKKQWTAIRQVENGYIVASRATGSYDSPKDESVFTNIAEGLAEVLQRALPEDITADELRSIGMTLGRHIDDQRSLKLIAEAGEAKPVYGEVITDDDDLEV